VELLYKKEHLSGLVREIQSEFLFLSHRSASMRKWRHWEFCSGHENPERRHQQIEVDGTKQAVRRIDDCEASKGFLCSFGGLPDWPWPGWFAQFFPSQSGSSLLQKGVLRLRVDFTSGFCEWLLRVDFASGFCEWQMNEEVPVFFPWIVLFNFLGDFYWTRDPSLEYWRKWASKAVWELWTQTNLVWEESIGIGWIGAGRASSLGGFPCHNLRQNHGILAWSCGKDDRESGLSDRKYEYFLFLASKELSQNIESTLLAHSLHTDMTWKPPVLQQSVRLFKKTAEDLFRKDETLTSSIKVLQIRKSN
jgi:hypothetical protein